MNAYVELGIRKKIMKTGKKKERPDSVEKGCIILVVLSLCTVCITCYHLILFQKYDNRSMMVQEAEVKHWKQLGIDNMTEESDDPTDPNAIIIDPLPWRSESEWVAIYI